MTLSNAGLGDVIMRAIHGGRGLRSRLYSFGLTPGSHFSVVRQDGCGRIMIRIRDSVFALGHGVAERIMVEPDETAVTGVEGRCQVPPT